VRSDDLTDLVGDGLVHDDEPNIAARQELVEGGLDRLPRRFCAIWEEEVRTHEGRGSDTQNTLCARPFGVPARAAHLHQRRGSCCPLHPSVQHPQGGNRSRCPAEWRGNGTAGEGDRTCVSDKMSGCARSRNRRPPCARAYLVANNADEHTLIVLHPVARCGPVGLCARVWMCRSRRLQLVEREGPCRRARALRSDHATCRT
jgi:hypothetical protein